MDDFYTVWKVDGGGLHNVVLTPLVPLYVTLFSHIFQSRLHLMLLKAEKEVNGDIIVLPSHLMALEEICMFFELK